MISLLRKGNGVTTSNWLLKIKTILKLSHKSPSGGGWRVFLADSSESAV